MHLLVNRIATMGFSKKLLLLIQLLQLKLEINYLHLLLLEPPDTSLLATSNFCLVICSPILYRIRVVRARRMR